MIMSNFKVRMSRIWLLHLIIFTGFLVNLSLSSAALAQGNGTFSMTPYSLETQAPLPNFVFEAEPEQAFQSAVLIKNESDEPVYVLLYPADATTGVNGDLNFSNRSDALLGAGFWITIEQPDLTLAAGESQIVPFTVQMPATARPGNHRAGIMAESVSPPVENAVATNAGEVNVKYVFRQGLNVRITVPGPTQTEFAITGVAQTVENNDTIFDVELSNIGSEEVRIVGGLIQVSDTTGEKIGEQPIPMSGLFLAGDKVSHPVRFTGLLPAGHYNVEVAVDYGANAPAQWRSEFEILPAASQEAAAEVNRSFRVISGVAEQSDSAAPVTAVPVTTDSVAGTQSIWIYVIAAMALIITLGIVISLVIFVARSRPSAPQDDYRVWGRQ